MVVPDVIDDGLWCRIESEVPVLAIARMRGHGATKLQNFRSESLGLVESLSPFPGSVGQVLNGLVSRRGRGIGLGEGELQRLW